MTDLIDSRMTHLLFAIFGAVGLWRGWRDLGRARASTWWPRADGEITSAELRIDGHHDDGEAMRRAVIQYRYEAAGERHYGERLFFGDDVALRFRGPAMRRLNAYPVGRRVRVAYDPAEPRLAVLEPGLNGAALLACVAAVVIAALAIPGVRG
jgi:hypothetical protein